MHVCISPKFHTLSPFRAFLIQIKRQNLNCAKRNAKCRKQRKRENRTWKNARNATTTWRRARARFTARIGRGKQRASLNPDMASFFFFFFCLFFLLSLSDLRVYTHNMHVAMMMMCVRIVSQIHSQQQHQQNVTHFRWFSGRASTQNKIKINILICLLLLILIYNICWTCDRKLWSWWRKKDTFPFFSWISSFPPFCHINIVLFRSSFLFFLNKTRSFRWLPALTLIS